MGTTADKLNRLIKTKEGIRQEINRAYGAEEVSTSDTFNSYIQKLEDHPFYLLEYIEGIIENLEVSGVTNIIPSLFYGYHSLSSVSLPDVTDIGKHAFYDCYNLSSVSFSSAEHIGDSAFTKCSNLSSVSFPNATDIGEYAFMNCSNLSSVSFPNVTRIFDDAFKSCGGLTTASFPKLTQIDNGSSTWLSKSGAFYNCSNLTTLYVGTEISTVCSLGDFALQGCSNLTNIYVPASLVDSYKSASNWRNYADKIKAAP